MSYPEIRFGTDGWRAVLGEGFTTDRFAAVMQALIATDELQAACGDGRPVVVAYDTRFQGPAFARLAATMLAEAGFAVLVGDGPAATPGIGATILAHEAACGVMITASHNPPEYQGFKIKGPYGGSATPEFIAKVQAALDGVARPDPARPTPFPAANPAGAATLDVNAIHLQRIAAFMDVSAGDDVLVHDAMYGSGRDLLARALDGTGAHVVGVRQDLNPGFGGVGPEPVGERLEPMFAAVRQHGAALGVATDGDADRVAACDAAGAYVFPHEIYALMLCYLVDHMGLRGRAVRNLATGELVARVAADRGCELVTTPVGFKHIVGEMLKGDVLIGGEESGGIAVASFLPERDGILCGLILRELMLRAKKPLRTLLDELYATYGQRVYRRWDLHVPAAAKEAILAAIESAPPERLGGATVDRIDRTDGAKFWLPDDHWLLVRASGTEPILRVYIEADSEAAVTAIYDAFRAWTDAHGGA